MLYVHVQLYLQRMSDRAHDRAVACEVRGKMYHNAREEIFLKRNQPAVNSTTTNFDPPQVVDHPATFVPTAPDAPPMTAYPPYPPPPYSEKP